jgi:hypothetical protein
MEPGDIASGLSPDLLTPASSVRAVGGETRNRGRDGESRRRSRGEENANDESPASEDSDQAEHELDRLA